MVYTFVTFCSNSIFALTHALRYTQFKGEIIYRVELPDMEQITLIYLENSDADYRKSSATKKKKKQKPQPSPHSHHPKKITKKRAKTCRFQCSEPNEIHSDGINKIYLNSMHFD